LLDGSTLYGTAGGVFSIQANGSNFGFVNINYPSQEPLLLVGARLYGVDATRIFSMDPNGGNAQTLHSFPPGVTANSGLSLFESTLIGTAIGGPYGAGVVFRVNLNGSGFHILHNFASGVDANPRGELTVVD
jgi:uncharacterized repeat protein (TIGR03803 family)